VTVRTDGVSRVKAGAPGAATGGHRVWIDQSLCTGDGLCVQEARDVFEFDLDGLAYVKNPAGDLLLDPGAQAPVPDDALGEVVDSARKCPGACIHVVRAADGVEVAGPDAE
jgi:ferredoxin